LSWSSRSVKNLSQKVLLLVAVLPMRASYRSILVSIQWLRRLCYSKVLGYHFARGEDNDICLGVKPQVRNLDDAVFMLRTWAAHNILSVSWTSPLAHFSECTGKGRNLIKAQHIVSPNSSSRLHTHKKSYTVFHTTTLFTQCSSTNPSSPSSPPSLWPLASSPPQQGNNKATAK
jgi:hypothetical protein